MELNPFIDQSGTVNKIVIDMWLSLNYFNLHIQLCMLKAFHKYGHWNSITMKIEVSRVYFLYLILIGCGEGNKWNSCEIFVEKSSPEESIEKLVHEKLCFKPQDVKKRLPWMKGAQIGINEQEEGWPRWDQRLQ